MTKMPYQLLMLIVVAVFSAATFANDAAAGSPLKVDLKVVVSTKEVTPVDGLSAAGQPDETALRIFAENGYKTVIDIRTAGENRGLDEAAVVDKLGMKYINLPIAGPGAISFRNARLLDDLLASAEGPVLLHCASGNRVGALLALGRALNGADAEEALEYGREGGMTRLEGRVREILAEE